MGTFFKEKGEKQFMRRFSPSYTLFILMCYPTMALTKNRQSGMVTRAIPMKSI